MKIEGVSDKTSLVINHVVNALIAIGIAVYYYDGFVNVACGSVVSFALINFWDALFTWVISKFKREEH